MPETPSDPAAPTSPPEPSEDLKAKCDEYLQGWQRANADYANLKKDMDRAQAEFAKYAAAALLKDILPVLDAFKKAMAQKPAEAGAAQAWVDGIEAIRTQFESALKTAGISVIDQAGVAFDPTRHEAMMMEKATKDTSSGSVVRVLEPGYSLHDRVLRPAKVVVAE